MNPGMVGWYTRADGSKERYDPALVVLPLLLERGRCLLEDDVLLESTACELLDTTDLLSHVC